MSIEVKDLSFSYGEREVLHDVSFSVEAGEFLSILGPNGVGKSTLFRCVLGLLRDYRGSITVEGRDARSLSIRESAKLIAYIPQSSHPAFNYSVRDIVLMGTTSGLGTFSTPKKEDLRRVDEALEKIGILELGDRCFHRISGGERQLALIARALVQRAPVLMLDEPTASLDFGNQLLVLNCARELAREGYTVIQTTHNPEQSYMFSDRILALRGGEVLTEGKPGDVLTPDMMQRLYGVEVEVSSLFDDRVRVCTPASVIVEK
ncbi:MAG TPA: ABC transporter ATP-binding protein [Candidatus Scatomorpha pullistercoris]|uniref:ABC transporter ATP-binding protein n=1 Tax=Candidatus Scatomorpha pullistercoris TaxID=2840929 RepID=A0A9D1G6Y1_9FIRM|nr:ABC transporter ATP-binding protein [Candidatus Scatomorpha pullistercoris]